MTCEYLTIPGGSSAIVCGVRGRKKCPCGNPATLLCDWKVIARRGRGEPRPCKCDRPLCPKCTFKPAPDKDLCPEHGIAFEAWKAAR